MTDKQKEFLQLAVIEKLTYDEISKKLELERKVFAPWWDALKTEREQLTLVQDKWQAKCPELDFNEFREWFEKADKKCFYCDITEKEVLEFLG